MNVMKVTLFIVNGDQLGENEIKEVIENTKYPNYCIYPEVMKIETKIVADWDDEHPLNRHETMKSAYNELFNTGERE